MYNYVYVFAAEQLSQARVTRHQLAVVAQRRQVWRAAACRCPLNHRWRPLIIAPRSAARQIRNRTLSGERLLVAHIKHKAADWFYLTC